MDYHHGENILKKLISEFEVMSQKGTVGFFEKTALLDMVAYFENEGNFEKAIEVCDFGLAKYVASYEFLFHKSRLFVEMEDLDIALTYLEEALTYSPESFDFNILKSEILIELGEFDEAYDVLKKLYETQGKEHQSQVLFLLSRIHEITGNYEKMFFALRKALRRDSTHPILLNKIWLAAELSGFYEESVKFHLELIERDPYSYLAWYNLGQAYFCLEDYVAAAEAFEYVFIINKQFDIAYVDAAESFLMTEDYTKALSIYKEYIELIEPDDDDAVLAKMGYCLENLGDVDTAKDYFLRSIAINPSNGMALFRMGECSMKEELWNDAIDFYNKAIEADCDQEEYLAAIAEAYFRNKNHQQAQIFFQKATEIAPELSKYWKQYAAFLMKMGNREEASTILDEALIYTGDTEVLYCKAACLFAMSKRKEALETLMQALKENVSLSESLFTLTPELKQDSEVKALIRLFEL